MARGLTLLNVPPPPPSPAPPVNPITKKPLPLPLKPVKPAFPVLAKTGHLLGLYDAGASLSVLEDALASQKRGHGFLTPVSEPSQTEKPKVVLEAAALPLTPERAAQLRLEQLQKLQKSPQLAQLWYSEVQAGGGEEYLSALMLCHSLRQANTVETMKHYNNFQVNVQKQQTLRDGSWTGKHCLTGKNFCTSAALLVLLADRAPY
jgi:hypothetical protein